MKITNVSVHEDRSYIPVKGWQGVIHALNLYANGGVPASGETNRVTADDALRTAGPLAVGLFALASHRAGGQKDTLVDRLLTEAGQVLRNRDSFHKSYDYDGMGTPFMKTSVSIEKLDGDMYAIGINAAYVGDKPEEELAKQLAVPRGLISVVEIEVEPTKTGFTFDFAPIMQKLNGILSFQSGIKGKKLTPELIAYSMIAQDDIFGGSNPSCGIHAVENVLEVRIRPGRVESRFAYEKGAKTETWSVTKSTFSGLLARDYRSDNPDAKANPTLEIVISNDLGRKLGFSKEPQRIYLPERQAMAIALANNIAAALK